MSLFRQSPVFRELKKLEKEEVKIKKQAENCQEFLWKDVLENKIPAKTFANLKNAFGNVRKQGRTVEPVQRTGG